MKPDKRSSVDQETATIITSPPGCDETIEFVGMGVKGVGHEFERISYHPRPLGDQDVEIEITHCGICASDIHTVDCGWNDQVMFPIIPGHEIIGVITAIGSDLASSSSSSSSSVPPLVVGQRVGVGPQVMSCQSCSLCRASRENYCADAVFTYNSSYPADGNFSFGGFADRIRVHAQFVLAIPDVIPSHVAAPLLCAGGTVYSPLSRLIRKPGTRVGVIGIGGLGHLAIQIAVALGGLVTAVSSSAAKKNDAILMGASDFLDMSNNKDKQRGKNKCEVVINTVTATGTDAAAQYESWLSLVAFGGTFVMVGLPDDPMCFSAWSLVSNQISLMGSNIASPSELRELMKLVVASSSSSSSSSYSTTTATTTPTSATATSTSPPTSTSASSPSLSTSGGIRAWVEVEGLSKVNDAVQRVRQGNVKYRLVLDISR